MISVYTPIHKINHVFMVDIITSLCNQTYKDFEWIIVYNGGLSMDKIKSHIQSFPLKVQYINGNAPEIQKNVAFYKGLACAKANGDILVELDYDDFLAPNALLEIYQAFQTPSVQFVYSNCVEFVMPKEKNAPITYNTYGAQYGWQSRKISGMLSDDEMESIAFPQQPQYMRRIEWCPNHVRSFRKSAYDKIGGYDITKPVGDDHDLVCRFFIEYGSAGFSHIDKPIYYYRVHSDNTCNGNNLNGQVQRITDLNMVQFIEPMFQKWSKDNNLLALDVGGGLFPAKGYQSVDIRPEADWQMDLSKPWTFQDNSVGVIRAYHVIEHLRDRMRVNADGEIEVISNSTIHFFNEAYRTLTPGGLLVIEVPSTSGDGAVSDPTHVKFFNMRNFRYFYEQNLAQFIRPEYNGRFQLARIVESTWPGTQTTVITVHLLALKGWYDTRWCGVKSC